MTDFKSEKDVAAWVAGRPNGLHELKKAIDENRFGGGRRQYALRYLELISKEQEAAHAAMDRELRAREVVAAERSAAASEESAAAAKSAARSARIAWYVAAGAFLLSVLAYITSR